MACDCGADGGEPRNTVGGSLSETGGASAGETAVPRSTTAAGVVSLDGTAASAMAEASATPLVSTMVWQSRHAPARCIAVLLLRSLLFHLRFQQRLRREAGCRACVRRRASLYSAARIGDGTPAAAPRPGYGCRKCPSSKVRAVPKSASAAPQPAKSCGIGATSATG